MFNLFVFLSVVPDDSAGPVDVTESVPLTAEALEKLFWQQFQTTATQTSRSQTPENTCLDGETQTEITYDVTSLGPASQIDPLTIGDTDSAVSTTRKCYILFQIETKAPLKSHNPTISFTIFNFSNFRLIALLLMKQGQEQQKLPT